MNMVKENGRVIPQADKVFALSERAQAAVAARGKENVVNAVVGALLDDSGDLVVMSSVTEAIRSLTPIDYAQYAPIAGMPAFKDAVKKALFGKYEPSGHVSVCVTPGGTGSITNVVSNYSEPGDAVLTHDWCWANYKNICAEQGRRLETFRFFREDGSFDADDLERRMTELADIQDQIILILNTPAHNPTGYALSKDDWDDVIRIINNTGSKVILFLDIAYIDYAGEEDEVRSFIPQLAGLKDDAMTIFGYSASKTLTAYGMRCGAIVCMAKTEEDADEFRRAAEYSARATWSNCNRSAMAVMARIYSDPELQARVDEERRGYREMLLRRGRVFEKALNDYGIKYVPFNAGFFVTVACDNSDEVCARLEEKDVYCLALTGGIRVSIASISEEKCLRCAAALAEELGK